MSAMAGDDQWIRPPGMLAVQRAFPSSSDAPAGAAAVGQLTATTANAAETHIARAPDRDMPRRYPQREPRDPPGARGGGGACGRQARRAAGPPRASRPRRKWKREAAAQRGSVGSEEELQHVVGGGGGDRKRTRLSSSH